jgi:hypothetical protein
MKLKFTKPSDLVTFLETNPKLMLIDADGDKYYVEDDHVIYHGDICEPLIGAHEVMISLGENKFKVRCLPGYCNLTVRFSKFKTFVRFLSDNKNKALRCAYTQHSAIFYKELDYVIVITDSNPLETPLSLKLFEQLFKDCDLTMEKLKCKR